MKYALSIIAMMLLANSAYGEYRLQRFARGLVKPVKFVNVPGTETSWIVEQAGRIKSITNEVVATDLVADLTSIVFSAQSETGLLGLAFHPDYPNDARVFVNYTTRRSGQLITRISSFLVVNERLMARSEKVLLSFDQPFANHNGGDVVFGPDGYLYIGVGDGGSAGDPRGFAQNLNSLLGKILRIDIDVETGYEIPEDNPFVNVADARDEIFAYGIRNPWGMSFDPKTGFFWVADVGQDKEEEINIVRSGGNYGWKIVEGSRCFLNPRCDLKKFSAPVHVYKHSAGKSVTGGIVYRGSNLPELENKYVFADFESGRVWALTGDEPGKTSSNELLQAARNIAAITADHNDELVIVDHGGRLYRLVEE